MLAAAVRAKAQLIVTANLKDFPDKHLLDWDVHAVGPDDFVLAQIDLDRQVVYAAVARIADATRRPPLAVEDVLDRLERDGLVASVAALRS